MTNQYPRNEFIRIRAMNIDLSRSLNDFVRLQLVIPYHKLTLGYEFKIVYASMVFHEGYLIQNYNNYFRSLRFPHESCS